MARYLIDANMPRNISVWSSRDCTFAVDFGDSVSDLFIWDYAFKHEMTIITNDADFVDRVLLSVAGPSVIHFRIGNMRLRQFQIFLQGNWAELCRLSSQFRLILVYQDRVECVS